MEKYSQPTENPHNKFIGWNYILMIVVILVSVCWKIFTGELKLNDEDSKAKESYIRKQDFNLENILFRIYLMKESLIFILVIIIVYFILRYFNIDNQENSNIDNENPASLSYNKYRSNKSLETIEEVSENSSVA